MLQPKRYFLAAWICLSLSGCTSMPRAAPSEKAAVRVSKQTNLRDLELPAHAPDETVLKRTGYRLSFDANKHVPRWVAYQLTAQKVRSRAANRSKSRFHPDGEVPGCPLPKEYLHSGYDKGHMIPAADSAWSAEAMDDSFLMTNIAPQLPELNRRVWSKLEARVRSWAEGDDLYVVTGPVLSKPCLETIGEGICVPNLFFKAVLDLKREKAIAFVIPQHPGDSDLQAYAVSVDALEELAGLDLFPNLEDGVETRVEARVNFAEWSAGDLARGEKR